MSEQELKNWLKECQLDSYNPDNCCGAHCNWLGKNKEEPCYGPVKYLGDGIHACVGHEDMDRDKAYIRPENVGY